MSDVKETQDAQRPLSGPSHRRYVPVPNTSGFWTDLALARCAYRSSSVIPALKICFRDSTEVPMQVELRAAVLHAMRWRIRNNVDPPRTSWDRVLAEMKWLREDYKCEAERKRLSLHAAAQDCIDGAGIRNEKMRLRHDEAALSQPPECGSTIPEWAREEYITQITRSQDNVPAPSSSNAEVSAPDPTTKFSASQPIRRHGRDQ